MPRNLQIGDLVWARMKGYSTWPGQVVEPDPLYIAPKAHMHWIYFFGTHDYAWIQNDQIQPYAEFKAVNVNCCKTAKFKNAIKDIEAFIIESETEELQTKVDERPKRSPVTLKRHAVESPFLVNRKIQRTISNSSKGDEEEFFLDDDRIVTADTKADGDSENSDELTVNISNFSQRFGFLGLDNIGSIIVKHLIDSGHSLYIWNPSIQKCEELKAYAEKTKSGLVCVCELAFEVLQNSDVIFSCLNDSKVLTEIVLQENKDMNSQVKGYVEISGIDFEASRHIYNSIMKVCGRYLEVQIQGSHIEAEEGSLMIMSSGDKSLFKECLSFFKAIGKMSLYLGPTGYATKLNVIIQMMRGVLLSGVAEALALADRSGISLKDFVNIVAATNFANPYLLERTKLLLRKNFEEDVEETVDDLQKMMAISVGISNQMKQPLSMAATANEVFKHAKRLGFGEQDAASIFMTYKKLH